jgi:hypothetical protein
MGGSHGIRFCASAPGGAERCLAVADGQYTSRRPIGSQKNNNITLKSETTIMTINDEVRDPRRKRAAGWTLPGGPHRAFQFPAVVPGLPAAQQMWTEGNELRPLPPAAVDVAIAPPSISHVIGLSVCLGGLGGRGSPRPRSMRGQRKDGEANELRMESATRRSSSRPSNGSI